MKFSVLTPTYNRETYLNKLYNSLLENAKYCNDFEWLIMDDGSTDNTKKLVFKWIKESKININYFYQDNRGKMSALNALTPLSKGQIIIEVDSDDYLDKKSFAKIDKIWDKVMLDDELYGALFLRKIEKSKQVKFPINLKESRLIDLFMKYGFNTDTTIVFKGDIRREYYHELEHGEKFVTEARMYNKIETVYRGLKLVNEPLIICEYQNDGYSKNIQKIFRNNPWGYYNYYKEIINMNVKKAKLKQIFHVVKHYILFSYLINKTKIQVIKDCKVLIYKILTIILIIPGYAITKRKFSALNK